MPFLEVHEVERRFASQVAVDGVSFSADKGEFVSLLGPSGSGKTTLLRIVAGFETPDAGHVIVGGKDVTFLPAQKRNMGMVFQSYALFPNMTATDNVAFGLRTRKLARSEIRQRVNLLLELVGLGEKGSRYPNQLSGGEQQRVALARALAPNPSVLLMDEPLSALDARIRVNLRGEIRRIQQTMGITTLYVTHDQEEALSMSDRIVVFNQGRAEQIGTPQEIYDQPASLFVSGFVGTMNRLTASVAHRQRGICQLGSQPMTIESLPDDVQDGDRVEIWIRPEGVRIASAEEAAQENSIEVLVEQVMFLGARYGIRAIIDQAGTLIVDVPRQTVTEAFEPGDRLRVRFEEPLTVTKSGLSSPGTGNDGVSQARA